MTLYRHFTGKDALIKAVLQHRHKIIVGGLEEELAARESAETRLRGFFDWYGTWFASREFAGCLFERALAEFGTTNPEISTVAVRYRQTLREWLQRILSELVPRSQAVQLSGVLVMLLDGATIEARAFNDPSAAKRAWIAAEALLARARQGTTAKK
jgi:AcrR family transcriptional regulator